LTSRQVWRPRGVARNALGTCLRFQPPWHHNCNPMLVVLMHARRRVWPDPRLTDTPASAVMLLIVYSRSPRIPHSYCSKRVPNRPLRVRKESLFVNSRIEPIAMTAQDLLTQWSINVDCVTACVAVVRQLHSWPTDCGEIVYADSVQPFSLKSHAPTVPKRVPNRPVRPRRCRSGTLLKLLQCGIFGRAAAT